MRRLSIAYRCPISTRYTVSNGIPNRRILPFWTEVGLILTARSGESEDFGRMWMRTTEVSVSNARRTWMYEKELRRN